MRFVFVLVLWLYDLTCTAVLFYKCIIARVNTCTP
nr:MAG TPA: Influenza Matrix protein (M2) [Bacteriophage sp.]